MIDMLAVLLYLALMRAEEYQDYCSKVKWRLIPNIL